MNKRVAILTKAGRTEFYVVRQGPTDVKLRMGGRLFRGTIIAIEEVQ